ncbi:MAG: hypothetical protein U0264_10640 [Candidatus Kapaibacterium sp.]
MGVFEGRLFPPLTSPSPQLKLWASEEELNLNLKLKFNSMIIYRNRLKFWRLRCVILKSAFLIAWAIVYVILDMPVLLAIVLLILPLAITIYMFLSKKNEFLSGITFNDEKKLLAIEYYRYCLKKTTVDIPYEKLWYLKGMSATVWNLTIWEHQAYDNFDIEMRENKSQIASVSLHYIHSSIISAFSEKDFLEILDKLDKVGKLL